MTNVKRDQMSFTCLLKSTVAMASLRSLFVADAGTSPCLDYEPKETTMVLTATKIIDGRDHLLGRLCSIVAKELLAGQTIVLVRCDEICISGSCKFCFARGGPW